jgi:hypothetical protein
MGIEFKEIKKGQRKETDSQIDECNTVISKKTIPM